MKFVPVHKAFDQIEAILIQGFLKNNGIKSVISPDMTDPGIPIIIGIPGNLMQI